MPNLDPTAPRPREPAAAVPASRPPHRGASGVRGAGGAGAGDHPTPPRTGLITGLLLAVTLHALHAMAIVTVAPLITAALDGRAWYGVLFSAYMLASLIGLVVASVTVSSAGLAPTFAVAMAVFCGGLLASAAAPSIEWLALARVFEGAGGGGTTTVLWTGIQRAYGKTERPRVLAWLSGAWVLPGLIGPPIAGWVAEAVGWRWVFLGVLPFALVAVALALPPLRGLAAPAPGGRDRGDRVGAAFALAAGVAALLWALGRPPDVAGGVVVGVGALVSLAAARPILPEGTLWARPGLPAAIACKLAVVFVFFGAETFIPLGLIEVRGISAARSGAVLTMAALTWTTGAFLQARAAQRVSPAALSVFGLGAIVLGIAGVAVTGDPAVPLPVAYLSWGAAGLGMGLAYSACSVAAMANTPPERAGETSAALGIVDALGFSLSAGIGGAWVAAAHRDAAPLADALVEIWFVAGVLGVATAALARRMRTPRDRPPASP